MEFIEAYKLSGGNYDVFVRLVNDPFTSKADAALFVNIKAAMDDAVNDDYERNKPK